MAELVRRVGGSKSTIYSYFTDKAGLFTAVVDELLKETVVFANSFDLSSLTLEDALQKIARQHLDVVLSDRYIRFIRIVAAEVDRFPELGKAFYEHGPGLSYANFEVFLREQADAGVLQVEDSARATDLFFGTLLHREVLERVYGVKDSNSSNHSAIATAVVAEFIDFYGILAMD